MYKTCVLGPHESSVLNLARWFTFYIKIFARILGQLTIIGICCHWLLTSVQILNLICQFQNGENYVERFSYANKNICIYYRVYYYSVLCHFFLIRWTLEISVNHYWLLFCLGWIKCLFIYIYVYPYTYMEYEALRMALYSKKNTISTIY